MGKYRLLTGTHKDGERTLHPGDVLESEDDLCARYNFHTLPPRFAKLDPSETDAAFKPVKPVWDPLGDLQLPPPR